MHFQWCCCGLKVAATSAEDTLSIFSSLRSDSTASIFFLLPFPSLAHHISTATGGVRVLIFTSDSKAPIAHPHCVLWLALQWAPNLILEKK